MRQGKVKWYNGKKCFGFISPDTANESGNQDDVFVHSSALKDSDIRFLNENDVVEFDDEVRNGKLSVTTLKLIKRDEESAKKFQERRNSFRDRDGGYDRPRRDYGDRPRRDFGDRPRRDRDEGDRKPGWKFWGSK
jgi:cold shock CspA family protein